MDDGWVHYINTFPHTWTPSMNRDVNGWRDGGWRMDEGDGAVVFPPFRTKVRFPPFLTTNLLSPQVFPPKQFVGG